ncbi:YdcF family protein [Caulifigura coniformis]|nr:ElyC/SanA/YdcF family protein [Caulifigura coniformis]
MTPSLSPRRRRRRWIRWSLLALFTAILLFHVPILRGIGRLLIVETAHSHPDALFMMSGDGAYNYAANAVRNIPGPLILKPEMSKTRLEELGIAPDRIAEFHRELARRGVPDGQRIVLQGEARNQWEALELLDRWLVPGSPQQVTALCDEFQTRRLKIMVDAVLKTRAPQLGIQPLTDRRFDATNWWKSRGGIRAVVLGGVSLAIASIHRGSPAQPTPFDPEEYETALKAGRAVDSGRNAMSASWLESVARWLDIGQMPTKVDHVVLLPGDEDVRPFVAAALVNAGLADDILLPRNHASPSVEDGLASPVHEIAAKAISRRGVSLDRFQVLSMKSDGTIEDAMAAREVLDQEPDARVAVVTSFYHTRRARMSFRAIYGPRADQFLYVSAPVVDFNAANWWKTDTGMQLIVTELVKVAIYWVSYGPGRYWLLSGLVLLIAAWRWRRTIRRRRKREELAKSVTAAAAVPA